MNQSAEIANTLAVLLNTLAFIALPEEVNKMRQGGRLSAFEAEFRKRVDHWKLLTMPLVGHAERMGYAIDKFALLTPILDDLVISFAMSPDDDEERMRVANRGLRLFLQS